jgi:biopolymer transport protein ExbD
MGYGRRRYLPGKKTNSTFGLNITSMTDMFTILLVFLLQSYSTSDVVMPEQGVNLPQSSTEANPIESLRVSISPTELKIEGRTIASLKDADFAGADVDPHDSNFILPLFKELDKINKENVAKKAALTEADKDKTPARIVENTEAGKILLQADQSLNYAVLRKVMYTASMAGFPKLKLATVIGD